MKLNFSIFQTLQVKLIEPPFWDAGVGFKRYTDYVVEVKSSSLKPGIGKIINATYTSETNCEVTVEFPTNVDVNDTYEHFVSFKIMFLLQLNPNILN